MAVGDKIAATDYNTIQGKIALVLGSGSGDYGYGQTVASSSVSANAKISMTQWANLRLDLLRARQHQIGGDQSSLLTDPAINLTVTASDVSNNRFTTTNTSTLSVGLAVTFSGTVFGGVVAGTTYYVIEVSNSTQFVVSATKGGAAFALTTATGSMTVKFGGIKITDADRAAYNALADTITTNRLAVPPSSEVDLPNLLSSNQTRAPGWNGVVQQTITVNFADANAARYFFNAGSQIQFSSTLTGGSTTPGGKDDTWNTILTTMGTIVFGYATTTAASGIGSAYGWSTLTSTQVNIFEKDVSGSTYYPNKFVILASKPSSSQLQFVLQWRDDSAPGGYGIDEPVGGTLTSYVQVRRPSTSNVTVSVPPATTSSIG